MKKNIELLAPAGSLKKCQYAFFYGADAVYAGIPDFSLRVKENTFNLKDIASGINLAHKLKKKFYLTVNIYAHNRHLQKLPAYIRKIKKIKPDALIVSDPGIVRVIKKEWPTAIIHLSTQANCTNWQAAKFWYESGVSRVILAREVSIKEIKEIHQRVPKLELEAFVQGAMCLAYSGRCVLSAALARRSANLGDCAQCCRWQYHLVEEKRPGEFMPIEEDQHGTYILSSQDMCLIEYLEQIKKAGICSLKIEGRNKSEFYLAHIIKAYRQVLDKKWSAKKGKEEILKVATRKLHTGFMLGQEAKQDPHQRRGSAPYKFIGEVIKYDKKSKMATVKVHNEIYVGSTVEIIGPKSELRVKLKEIINAQTGKKMPSAHGGSQHIIKIKINRNISDKFLLRIKKNNSCLLILKEKLN